MHHVGAAAHLTAEALTKEESDIGFIIDNQNADAHPSLQGASGVAGGR
jgi:hypothetical protein